MLTQASRTFIMFAFLLSFASIKAEDIPAGVMPNRRQVQGTGVTPSTTTPPVDSTTPPTSDPPTSDPPTTNPPDPTPSTDPTTDDPTTDDPTTNDDPTSTDNTPTVVPVTTTNSDGDTVTTSSTRNNGPVETISGTKNSLVKIGSKTIDPATLSEKTTLTSALIGKETKKSTYTSYWTSDGTAYSSVVTENRVVSSTTGFATATINPSLADGGGDGGNLSDSAKNIIGGVVGGIGGAILIGGLAFVAWRLWFKKKGHGEMQDEYANSSQNDSLRAEKRTSNMTFDTEPYHTPGRVNTASNF